MKRILFSLLVLVLTSTSSVRGDDINTISIPTPPPAVLNRLPESISDLKAFQDQTRIILKKVIPATVCLQVGSGSGSGVIVSKDGLILTAAHVTGEPGKNITIVMPDGKRVKGVSLGINRKIDSGMAKITTPGEWPFIELADPDTVKVGQWCIATGHPGGYSKGRSPVVRVGRIGTVNKFIVQTDCTLVGGDSGGPLFNMEGKIIGIHSRIGGGIVNNIHVPCGTFKETWDELVAGDAIGEALAWLGVRSGDSKDKCLLGAITPESPAEKAGLKQGDVVLKFDGTAVKLYEDMINLLKKKRPGQSAKFLVLREGKEIELTAKLIKRPE